MKDRPKNRYIASMVLNDDRLVEMTYDEKENTTKLAISNNGAIDYLDSLEANGINLTPHKASNHLVSKKVILFPSKVAEYSSESELILEIKSFIHSYLDVSPFFERIAPFYVLLTWAYDKFNELPYLRALGDYGSGKSRFLQVIGSICYKPMFAGGATTTAPIFRIIDEFRGTLILDEADYRFSDTTAEIIKILNSGYQRGSPVLRTDGKNFEIKSFDVFCPKLIATRHNFQDTALESRCLTEDMDKIDIREDIPINLPSSFYDEALDLRNKLLMFRFKKFHTIKLNPNDYNKTLAPRLNQIIIPLLSIIDDNSIKNDLKRFSQEYNAQLIVEKGMGFDAEIVEVVLSCLKNSTSEPTIQQIADSYNADKLNDKERLHARRMGHIINKTLKLKTKRTNQGWIVLDTENREMLGKLKRKFGLIDDESHSEEVNNVNNVNVVKSLEEATKDTPTIFGRM